jgi:hypothetical protein
MTTLRRPVFFQAKIEISYYLEAAARNHVPAFFAGSCSRSYVLDGASIPLSADPFSAELRASTRQRSRLQPYDLPW